MLLAWIRQHPGTSFRATCRGCGLAAGTTAHHVRILKRQGLVQECPFGQRRLFFPAGMGTGNAGVALILADSALRCLRDWLEAHPGASQRDVLDAMQALHEWPRSSTQHRLRRLAASGLLLQVPVGGRRLAYRIPDNGAPRTAQPMAAVEVA